jgi:hypothetical protein
MRRSFKWRETLMSPVEACAFVKMRFYPGKEEWIASLQEKDKRMATHQQKWERVWFITGSSSGFGRALTEAVLTRGERVVAGARRLESLRDLAQHYPEQILVVPLDVTKREQPLAR